MIDVLHDVIIHCNISVGIKSLKKYLLSSVIIIVVTATGPLFSAIQAGEHHHHDAHVHGVAHLNVALEGNDLYIELTSPAANIVGFEHDPRTQNQ